MASCRRSSNYKSMKTARKHGGGVSVVLSALALHSRSECYDLRVLGPRPYRFRYCGYEGRQQVFLYNTNLPYLFYHRTFGKKKNHNNTIFLCTHIPHNLAYKTRILRGGRSDRGAFEHSLIGRMVLWQSISYRRVNSTIIP